jgi:MYXO-CTERM domain-containing protein
LTLDPVTDPEGDAITYLYEVYSDEALADLVASGEADEVVWTTDPALDEDNAYWWRAAARDDLGAQSAWATPARFTTNTNNTLPEAPKVVSPAEGERVGAVPVAVVWEQAVDNDGDELLYELEVARDESFGEVVFSQTEIPMGDENTVTVEVDGLEEDASYWLRVRASDFEGAGPYKVVAFSINADPTPPTAPTLISPVDGVVVDGPTVRFSFSSAQDFDGDTLTYVVKVSRDEEGRDVVVSLDDIADSDVEIAVELEIAEAGEYWWTAFAVDSTNLEGPSAVAENFKLTIDTNAPPSAPVLVSPVDGVTVDVSKDFVLTWEDATDPDGDALTYEVGVYSDEALAVAVFEVDEVAQGEGGQSTVTVPGVETSAELLFWTVRAKDSAGNVGPAATPGEFKPEIKAGQVAGGGGDGCDCAVGGSKQGAPWTAALLLGLLVWWSRRRR